MNWHPTDEDLILHFYGESPAAGGARIERHLSACVRCREAWTDLGETMQLVDSATTPEPDAGFERVVWARVAAELPSARRPRWSWSQLIPAAGLAAAVVALVAVSAAWQATLPAEPRLAGAARGDTTSLAERVLLTALDSHFEQAEMLLVELMNTPDAEETELAFERTAADDLVSSGRLYRVTAQESGDLGLVHMLDDLESVLVDVARAPDTLNLDDLHSLRSRIDDEGLLFKVRAVTNDIRGRQDTFTTHEGPL
jgi:hypothetical protein